MSKPEDNIILFEIEHRGTRLDDSYVDVEGASIPAGTYIITTAKTLEPIENKS